MSDPQRRAVYFESVVVQKEDKGLLLGSIIAGCLIGAFLLSLYIYFFELVR